MKKFLEYRLRIKCMKLACRVSEPHEMVVEKAHDIYNFIKTGGLPKLL
jgi:hypothetical protein